MSKTMKPKKPYRDFPLTPHLSGWWCKKIRGKIFYFGKWGKKVDGKMERLPDDGWKEALELYKAQRDDLQAGRTPKPQTGELTVADLCNSFRTWKLQDKEHYLLSNRMYDEYVKTCDRLVATFGANRLVSDLNRGDFAKLRGDLAKQYGVVRLVNEITKVRSVFKFGFEDGLMDRPVRLGRQLHKPSRDVLRRHRAKQPKKFLDAADVRKLIDNAPPILKAMVLLAVNAGFGPGDIAELPLSALDLDGKWVTFPRPKNGITRRAKLWYETVAALTGAIALRPDPKNEQDARFVFLTSRGRPWLCREIANPVSVAIRTLMKSVGIHGQGLGAYTLRHVFRTVADEIMDTNAIRLVMGHSSGNEIDSHYIEKISDHRLVAVADYVHDWLFGPAKEERDVIPMHQKPRVGLVGLDATDEELEMLLKHLYEHRQEKGVANA
jgi:integrase